MANENSKVSVTSSTRKTGTSANGTGTINFSNGSSADYVTVGGKTTYNYGGQEYTDAASLVNAINTPASTSSSSNTGSNSGPANGFSTDTSGNSNTGSTSTKAETPVVDNSSKGTENTVKTDTEIKQEGALKPLSQEYYNQTSQEAQDKIVKNLNDYKQSNPEYFRDYESFKKNFSYDARDDVQKNTLDEWYKGYQEGLSLASTPTTDLYTQYKNGDLSDAQLQNLRVSDPTKYSELMNQINKGNIVAAYDDDKGEDAMGMSIQEMAYQMMQQTFMQFMNGGSESGASQYFRAYEEKMNSPEMMELSDQTTELQEQAQNIQDDIASMTKAVEKEYEGTGASRAKISAIVADRTYELQLQLRTVNNEYTKYATQYNNRMQQYQNEFQLQLQEYQINQQERQQMMNELGFAMDLMSFETPQQKQDRERDYWVKQQEYTNGDINSKDYSTRYKAALKSVQNLLSQYEGIPMIRSAEEMAQDILNAIDAGSDLGTELTKINKQIQAKDEYQYMYNKTFAEDKPSGFGKTFSLNGTDYIVYDDELYTADEFNAKFGGKVKAVSEEVMLTGLDNYKKKVQSLVNTGSAIRKGWCGEPVNDYLKSIGSDVQYDNFLSTKINSITPGAGPKVGSIAIWDGSTFSSPAAKEAGHVAIVTGVDEANGTITVLESNGQAHSMGMGYGTYKISNVTGFYDPSAGSKSSTGDFVSGSIDGVPLAYERAVKNLVPAALQNSDAEREALNKIITNAFDGLIDQSEIALKFMGFDIRNEGDKELAMDLVNTVRTLTTDTQEGIVQTISDLMNQGNYTKAIQTVENAVSKQAKESGNYVSESSVKNTINRSNELSSYINGLDKSPVGVVKGTMQDWLGKLSSKDAKEIANRIGLVESSLDIKDEELLKKIVPQLSDQPSVFMSKLTNLNSSLMSELNGWRNIYGLPSLTTGALTNYSNRVDLYKNSSASNNASNEAQSEVVIPNMSTMQDVIVSDMGNGILTRVVNGRTEYSGDGGKTRH